MFTSMRLCRALFVLLLADGKRYASPPNLSSNLIKKIYEVVLQNTYRTYKRMIPFIIYLMWNLIINIGSHVIT